MQRELLTATGLTHYVQQQPLFSGVALLLHSGQRIALAGANGSGKSTLLQLLAGTLQPAEGSVSVAPGSTRTFVMQAGATRSLAGSRPAETVWQRAGQALQTVTDLERQLRAAEASLGSSQSLAHYAELHDLFEQAGGYGAQGRLRELLAHFGLGEERHAEPFSHLSSGEQQRVRLAAALASPEGILLLDEPDAALDAAARFALAAQLRSYPGGVIFSSHDRAFIDSVASHTARLHQRRLQLAAGGYSRQHSSRREASSGAVRIGASARSSWQLQSAASHAPGNRLLLELGPLQLPLTTVQGQPEEPGEPPRSLQLPELSVSAGDRIVLLGPNGSGKSTLLQFLADSLYAATLSSAARWSDSVHLEHWDQPNRGLQPTEPVVDQLQKVTSAVRAGQLLGLLRVPYRAWQLTPEQLSGGERARVAAARLIAVQADLLLLDEPTMDLDITAIENLQDALLASDAAVVLVTHDLALAGAVADRVWAVKQGELVEYRGGLAGYQAGRRRREPGIEQLQLEGATIPASEPITPLAAAEDELLAVSASLDGPLQLSEREQVRLRLRQLQLQQAVDLLVDASFPPPEPRFSVREAGIRVQADLWQNTLTFHADTDAQLQLLVTGDIAHLILQQPESSCLLPWARVALLNAATRLAFQSLGVRAVQYAHAAGLPQLPADGQLLLRAAGDNWFVLSQQDFVRSRR